MEKIDNHELCHCGSGKRQEDCCGNKNVISLEQFLDDELKNVQIDIIHFALEYFEEEIHDYLNDWTLEIYSSNEAYEMFFFFSSPWLITSIEIEGKTIMEHYIDQNSSKWKRQRTKDILKSWKMAKPIVAIINDIQNFKHFILQDILTNEKYNVKTLDADHPVKIGDIILGVLLPAGSSYVFFTSFVNLPAHKAEEMKESIIYLYEDSNSTNLSNYLTSNYLDVLYQFIYNIDLDLYELEWTSPKHLEVAEEFIDYMEVNQDRTIIELGIFLWYEYCLRKNPKILKPSIYSAALIYLIDQLNPFGELLTQNELAEQFQVSSSSLSAKYRDMEKVLRNEITELREKLDSIDYEELFNDIYFDNDFDDDDNFLQDQATESYSSSRYQIEQELLRLMNEMDNESIHPDIKVHHHESTNKEEYEKEKAQELLFDAYEANGERRIALAKKALKIYPNLPEAYNILADAATDPLEEEKLLLTAMEVGEKELGKQFFKENRGDFWGIVSTRSFMRAKYNYAMLLQKTGRLNEAVKQFEELLELNPNDNQGVRYEIFPVYVKLNLLNKAENILNLYDESDTAFDLYNRTLIEFLQHGPTRKAKALLQKAFQQNRYVPDYLTGKKKIPLHLPLSFQDGQMEEAIIYAEQTSEIWRSNQKLLEWLKSEMN